MHHSGEIFGLLSGTEFVSDEVRAMLIVRALYLMKRGGASWRSMLANTLGKYGLGYKPSKYNKEVWIKREFLPNRKIYYSIVLIYGNVILFFLKGTSTAISYLENIYVLKEGILGPPYRYLSAIIEKVKTANGSAT